MKALSHLERLSVERAFAMPLKDTPLAKKRQVRDRAILFCLMYIGLNLSETEALTLPNVEIARTAEDSYIYIREGVKRRAEIPPKARVAFIQWLKIREELSVAHPYFFVQINRNHAPLGKRSIQRIIRAGGYRAKLKLTPQLLRKTATRFWRERESDSYAAQQMGHGWDTVKRYPPLD